MAVLADDLGLPLGQLVRVRVEIGLEEEEKNKKERKKQLSTFRFTCTSAYLDV